MPGFDAIRRPSPIIVMGLLLAALLLLMILAPRSAAYVWPGDPHEPTAELQYSVTGVATDSSSNESQVKKGRPLSERATRELLSRLPPLPEAEAQKAERSFDFGGQSTPADTTETRRTEFSSGAPPPPRASEDLTPNLRIQRVSPVGETPLATEVSIVFSKPMVALGPDGEADQDLPVQIEPRTPGKWSWSRPNRLVFEPEAGRFPMASEFRVRIGRVEARGGGRLDEPEIVEFRTAPPEVESVWRGGWGRPIQPLFVLEFNQEVPAWEVVQHLRLQGPNSDIEIRRATEAEIREAPRISNEGKGTRSSTVVVRAAAPLPPSTRFELRLLDGVSSKDGPLEGKGGLIRGFESSAPLTFRAEYCYPTPCRPDSDWWIAFTHRLEEESVEPSMIRISPEMPNRTVDVRGYGIQIRGDPKPGQDYEVSIESGVASQSGRTLESSIETDFSVHLREPSLYIDGRKIVADPTVEPTVEVWSSNLEAFRLTVRRVEPADWTEFPEASSWLFDEMFGRRDLPGEVVAQHEVQAAHPSSRIRSTPVSLEPYLEGEYGHLVVMVEPIEVMEETQEPESMSAVSDFAWVQVTDLALDAFAGSGAIHLWVSRLTDGAPVSGADIRPLGVERWPPTKTDRHGVAEVSNTPLTYDIFGRKGVVATRGSDAAILPMDADGFRHPRSDTESELRWHTYSDRKLYRPGEVVHVKGWMRRVSAEGLKLPAAASHQGDLKWNVRAVGGDLLANGETEVSGLGGFQVSFELPEDNDLGLVTVEFRREAETGWGSEPEHDQHIWVSEFRTPSFEVSVDAPAGPHIMGEALEATTSASYLSGDGLSGAEVKWKVGGSAADYAPPGWVSYEFGPEYAFANDVEVPRKRISSYTGSSGRDRIRIDPTSIGKGFPVDVHAEASVTDISRQTVTGEDRFLLHPASVYVGLEVQSQWVETGDSVAVDAVSVSVDGEPRAGRPIRILANQVELERVDGDLRDVVVGTEECTKTSRGAEPVTCHFEAPEDGDLEFVGIIQDEQGRTSRSVTEVWVDDPDGGESETVEMESAGIRALQDEWEVGESAELLIRSPFESAEGMLLIHQGNVIQRQRFQLDGWSTRVEVPVDASFVPSVMAEVLLIGDTTRQQGGSRPAQARGETSLRVAPRLDVSIQPSEGTVSPGGSVPLKVEVRRPDGSPAVDSEVALAVVDEGILAAAQYRLKDPLATFIQQTEFELDEKHLRSFVVLGAHEPSRRDGLREPGSGGGGMGFGRVHGLGEVDTGSDTLSIRDDIRPFAHFAGRLETNDQGVVSTTVELPDNLTRWRLMAVAADDAEYFGTAQDTVTTRLPVSVRPSLPRFLNRGDRTRLPVLVHNQSGKKRRVDVVGRTEGLTWRGTQGRSVEVPAHSRAEVQFSAEATSHGEAQLQFAAASGEATDAVERSIPVRRPSTTEFAAYGSIGDTEAVVRQNIGLPGDVFSHVGELTVTTSSSALQELTDAFEYLVDYPYGCTEQISSTHLGIAALHDAFDTLESGSIPEPETLRKNLKEDIKTLERRQKPSGGFTLWDDSSTVWVFPSLHATLALHRLEEAGYEVPSHLLSNAARYAADLHHDSISDATEKVRRTIHAYALYVLDQIGEGQPIEAAKLLKASKLGRTLSLEGAGWLLTALEGHRPARKLVDETLRRLQNRVTETASSAYFPTEYSRESRYWVMHSSRRVDAVLLESWIAHRPDSELVQKLVRGLRDARQEGRWANTQENAFVLMAFRKYLERYESTSPDFAIRMWLGDGYLGSQNVQDRTTEDARLSVPMRSVLEKTDQAKGETAPLTIQKEGRGRLYYRIGLSYAPKSFERDAASAGFTVQRTFEAVDDPDDVSQRDDGTWVVEAGSRVRVTLEMAAPARRNHVALVDPLPAGLEAINPALGTTGSVPDRRFRWWYDQDNLRTERVEAFATRLAGGVYTYEYVARATTPGEFVVPPAKAEEMYHPETFGRTGTARMVVRSSDSP